MCHCYKLPKFIYYGKRLNLPQRVIDGNTCEVSGSLKNRRIHISFFHIFEKILHFLTCSMMTRFVLSNLLYFFVLRLATDHGVNCFGILSQFLARR